MPLDFSSQAEAAPVNKAPDFSSQSVAASTPQEDSKPWYSEGYLGRVASATAEKAASIGMSESDKATYQKYYPHAPDAPTAGVADSLKYLGNQIVSHPLDAIEGLAKGLAQDPELLFPALWEAAPAKLAAVVKAGGAAAKVAETTARGAAIGAAAEATAGYSEGKMDPQKVANTAVMFGVMGGVTRGAVEGGAKAWEASKGAIIQKAPVKEPLSADFKQSKIRPDETVGDVMARKAEGKHLAQAALKNKETGEIVPQGAKHDDTLKAEVVERPNIFHTTREAWAAQQDKNQAMSDRARNQAAAKENEPIVAELEKLKDINSHSGTGENKRPRTLEESLKLASLDDQYSINLIKHNPEQHLKDFRDQLQSEKQDLEEAKGTGNEWSDYDSQRLPTVNDLLTKLDQFESRATAKVIDGHTPEGPNSKYAQGFIDGDGNFLNRHEALARAQETKQLPKGTLPTGGKAVNFHDIQNQVYPKLDFPEEGLHSGDLRKAGDPSFQTATPPDQLQGIADAAMNKVDADVQADMRKDWEKNNTVLTHAANVVGDAMAHIRSLTRRATIYGKSLKDLIPDAGQRDRVTRALEAEKFYDKIYTDAGKASALSSMQNGLRKISNEIYTLEQDAKTDPKVLADKVDQFNRLKFSHDKWAAQPSEEHLIPILKQVQDRLKAIGDQAKEAGLIEELRNNYVTHILDFSKSKLDVKQHQALLDKIFNAPKDSKLVKDFTETRKYDYLRTLEEAVAGTGVVVHTDIAIIAEAYEKSMLSAIVHKKMIDYFMSEKAPNGKGYLEKLTPEILAEGYKVFQGKGSRPLLGLAVHPDVADAMGHMFQLTDPDMLLRALGSVSMLTKTINTVASLFHATNLGIAATTADPALMVKEILTGGSGIRAAAKAFKTDENHALINLLMDNGFMAGSEDVQRTIVHDIGVKTDQLLSKFAPADHNVKAVQYLTEPFDKQVLQRVNSFTWDYMHTGSKLNLAMNRFKNVKLKNPDMPDAEIAKEVSRFVNNTFGGLNWIDVANQTNNYYLKAFAMRAAGMKGRAWGQVMMFAPDWTVSTLRSFTTALPQKFSDMHPVEGLKGMWNPKTQGDFARRYVLNTAIGYMTIQNAINIATSGHPIWENKDPTRVDLGDGTSMQVAKHSMEVAEWVRNPSKTLGNKLGFWPKSAYIEVSGRAYPGPEAPKIKPIAGSEELGKARAILLQASPFQLSAGAQAPEGEGIKRAIASALGMPTYGMTHADRKAAIAKGKEEAKAKREKKKYDFSGEAE